MALETVPRINLQRKRQIRKISRRLSRSSDYAELGHHDVVLQRTVLKEMYEDS